MPPRTPCSGGRNGDPSFQRRLNWPDGTWRLFSVAGLVATAKINRLAPSTASLLVFLHEALPISRTGLEADTMLKPLDQEQENDLDDVMCDYGLVRYDSYNT